MKQLRLNYLQINRVRKHRKQARLTHDELAFLLGYKDGTSTGKIEKFVHDATLRTALRLQALFGVDVDHIFAGVTLEEELVLPDRITELETQLRGKKQTNETKQKLSWLARTKARIAARLRTVV